MDENLLKLFKSIYEKQAELSILTDSKLFEEYSNSQIHTIDIIGSLELVNGVKIAEELNLTRGAVSKITSKLRKKGLIDNYQIAENKKEVYYSLSLEGKKLYKAHQLAHRDWELRELKFFKDMDPHKKEIVEEFLASYNDYLGSLISERMIK